MLDFQPRFTLLEHSNAVDRLDEALLASLFTRHTSGIESRRPAARPPCARAAPLPSHSNAAAHPRTRPQRIRFVVVDLGSSMPPVSRVLAHRRGCTFTDREPRSQLSGIDSTATPCREFRRSRSARFQIIIHRARQNDAEPVVPSEKI